MKWSLPLGKPFGIGVFIHWTFLILIGWIAVSQWRQGGSLEDILWMTAFVLVLFVCVTLHELGHALAARKYHINTKSIVLLPIGGVANLESIPEEPRQELIVAAAGPMVNVIIALLLLPVLWLLTSFTSYSFDPAMSAIGKNNFLVALIGINILMVLFNLIPAFPMDGGRMLRAILSFKMDRVKATKIAVKTGQFFAIAFAFWGIFYNPFLVLIAIFVWISAQSEYMQVRMKSQLAGHLVGKITVKDFHVFDVNDSLSQAVNVILTTQYENFLVMDGSVVKGLISKEQVFDALSNLPQDTPVSKVMDEKFEPLNPDQPLEQALHSMQSQKKTILPVISSGVLIGVLDRENISEFLSVKRALHKKSGSGIESISSS